MNSSCFHCQARKSFSMRHTARQRPRPPSTISLLPTVNADSSIDALHLSPEIFSDPRTEDGRKRGKAERSGCLSIYTTEQFQVYSSRYRTSSVGRSRAWSSHLILGGISSGT